MSAGRPPPRGPPAPPAARRGPGGRSPSRASTPPRWTTWPRRRASPSPCCTNTSARNGELYLELLDDVGQRCSSAITKATESAAGRPASRSRPASPPTSASWPSTSSAFRVLFGGGARRDEEFADAVRRVEDAIAEAIAALIEADIDDDHRRLLAHGIVGLAEGTSRHWVGQRARPRPRRAGGARRRPGLGRPPRRPPRVGRSDPGVVADELTDGRRVHLS